MKKIENFCATIIISSFAAISAMSPTAASAAESHYNWTGAYAGIQGGFGTSDVDWTFDANTVIYYAPGDTLSHSPSGAMVGGQVGFNYQIGQFLVGIEGALRSDLGSEAVLDPGPPVLGTSRVNSVYHITGRLGYVHDNWLVFAKGGYANGRVQTELLDDDGIETDGVHSQDGYVVGGALK